MTTVNKMKIKTFWFINDYAGSKHHGMVFRDYYIAKELIKKGHKVYIISSSYTHLFKNPPEVNGHYTHETIDGIEYVWIKVLKYNRSTDKKRVFNWFIFLFKTLFLGKQNLPTPDYIVAGQLNPFLIVSARYLARKYKAKLASDIRDLWPLTLTELGGYDTSHPFIRLMQWFSDYSYRKANITTTSLPNAYEYLKTRGLKKERFKFIPNGVSLDDMQSAQPLNENTINQIPKNKFIIGYAGGMGIAKSLDTLLKAAVYLKKYDDIAIVLVGGGRYEVELKKMKQDINLDNVTFIPSIPKDEVPSVLALFDVCFIATKRKKLYQYGVSQNKLFDYLYAAKPILYAINDKNSVIDQSGCGITVDSSNPENIANGAIELYNLSNEQRQNMGKKGKKLILQQHNFQNSAERLLEAFEEL
jgi:glycosyltransferase involved in cell wall biosynthesis